MAKQPVTLMNSVPYGQPVPNRRANESPTRSRATAPAARRRREQMAVPRPTARHSTRRGASAAQQAFAPAPRRTAGRAEMRCMYDLSAGQRPMSMPTTLVQLSTVNSRRRRR